MINRKLFVFVVLLISCGAPKPEPDFKSGNSNRDSAPRVSSAIDTNTSKASKAITVTAKGVDQLGHPKNCEDMLFSLIDKSSYDPRVKKFKYSVRVDSLADGVAILKITMYNTEQHQDRAIGWLKLDFNTQKLTDITYEGNPMELTYDTVVLRQIIENCRIR
ncbi:MAG: hypothetical protein JST42_03875 [Bacteroidetes bacterium]|nr:hypothetical protein [Bacteroidota bacterium]